ncbi:MAG: extracellular solute-binding protein [Mycobacterium leprae]
MHRAKRSVVFLALIAMLVSLLAACSSKSSSGDTAKSDANAPKKVEIKAGEKVKVTFWHAMGGHNGEVIQALVDEFNKSQDKVQVEAVYQGTYDEALQKLKAAGPNGPSMIQVYEIGSRFMIDSGLITPMQQFVTADNFDTKDIEPQILNYYSMNGKLNSMPFNTSTPLLYYNKTAFKEAGLDPEKPPKTLEEFAQDAKILTKKQGNDIRYGAGFAIYGWFFEQLMATQGAYYTDNNNARTAKATKATIDGKEGQTILQWWKDMIDAGSAANLGRKTADSQNAFMAGRVAMTLESTAVLGNFLKGIDNKFELGTGYLPRPASAGNNGGVIIGGASLWITNTRPEKEQWAAWEFVKWLSSPAVQAKWYTQTGYFPIVKSAYDQQIVKDAIAKTPMFKTAIDQLHSTPVNQVTQGAVIGVFPQARVKVEDAIENTILGKATAADALKSANADITKLIEDYNKTTK